MRALRSTLLGLLAAVMGTFVVVPRINRALWPVQLVLSEFSWGVVGFGLWRAVRSRTGSGRALALFGAALAAVPLTQANDAAEAMDAAMREGFGPDYNPDAPSPTRRSAVSETLDFAFVDRPTRNLRLDVYRPQQPPVHSDRYPAVLVLHGGGWRHGDKGGLYAPHHRELAAQGYVVFDAQYRLTVKDGERWPAQLDDARAAIRWVKANADEYNLDPERIVLLGRSAGGHIALQAAYRATGDDADTRVCAVVAYYAPTNLRLTRDKHDERVLLLLGDTSYNIPDVYADASPLDFAGGDAPPTLLLHGYMDSLVTPIHTELLVNKLRSCRVPVAALRIPWGRHAFDISRVGMGARMSQRHVDRFLAWAVSRNNPHAG